MAWAGWCVESRNEVFEKGRQGRKTDKIVDLQTGCGVDHTSQVRKQNVDHVDPRSTDLNLESKLTWNQRC